VVCAGASMRPRLLSRGNFEALIAKILGPGLQ